MVIIGSITTISMQPTKLTVWYVLLPPGMVAVVTMEVQVARRLLKMGLGRDVTIPIPSQFKVKKDQGFGIHHLSEPDAILVRITVRNKFTNGIKRTIPDDVDNCP